MKKILSRTMVLLLVFMLGFGYTPLLNEETGAVVYASSEKELSLKKIASFDKSVVMVFVKDEKDKSICQGSGFCIGKGLFLTNYHVIEDMVSSYIVTNEQKKYEIEGIVKYDTYLDLALIKTKKPVAIKPLKIGSISSIEKGEKIVTIGSPEGLQNTISDGIVSGFRKIDDVDVIQITAPITHGSSGGPLFNMNGYVVGVNTSGFDDGNLNFAIAIDHAKPWIDELNKKPFSKIAVLKEDDFKIMDNSVSDEEITAPILKYIEAVRNEDVEAYLEAMHITEGDYEIEKMYLQDLFDTYKYDAVLKDYEIIEKTKEIAKVKVEEIIRTTEEDGYSEDLCIQTTVSIIYTLMKYEGRWCICVAENTGRKIEYLRGDIKPLKVEMGITKISVDSITDNSANIKWETSLDSVCKVEYGTSTEDSCTIEMQSTPSKVYSIELNDLKSGTKYYYLIQYKDKNGNYKTTKQFTFTTTNSADNSEEIDLTNMKIESIDLNTSLDKIVYDSEHQKAYGIDKENKKILVIDMEEHKVENEIRLVYKPSDLCIVNDKKRIYVANEGSSFITELSLDNYKITKNIPCDVEQSDDDYEERHFHIYYKNSYLYVVDEAWAPGLWRINIDNYTVEDFSEEVNKIGDLVFTEDGNQMYFWHHYGWSAGWAGCNVYKYSVDDKEFNLLDESDIGYPKMKRDPLDTPIILMEEKNQVICKKCLFNMHNLKQVYYTFPEEIYAIDPKGRYVVGKQNIYDLEFYDVIAATPKQNADQYFFDKDGIMYMLVNSDKKLYFVSKNN